MAASSISLNPSWPARRRFAGVLLVLLGVWLSVPASLRGQATWEYSPYSIQVWISFDASAELTSGLAKRIEAAIAERSWVVAGATWKVRVVPCPAALAFAVARQPEQVSVDAVGAAAPGVLKEDDKLYLLSVRDSLTGLTIVARELDCRTRMWQPIVTRDVVQPARVADEAFAALLDAFVPFGRVESSKGKEAVVRVRAGGLILDDRSPRGSPSKPCWCRSSAATTVWANRWPTASSPRCGPS